MTVNIRRRQRPDPVRLNAEQLAFLKYQGATILHAPVGTGKTLALAELAAEAILAGTKPSRILCLTFTNRAAEEMRDRILHRCGANAKDVVVRTFHAFGAWFLRMEAKRRALPADFLIFDEEDCVAVLSAVLRAHGGSSTRWSPGQAKGLEFDTVFVAGLSEGEFPNYFAIQEGRVQEEWRIFYVAISRAKERLFLTGHRSSKGYARRPSRFLRLVPQDEALWAGR